MKRGHTIVVKVPAQRMLAGTFAKATLFQLIAIGVGSLLFLGPKGGSSFPPRTRSDWFMTLLFGCGAIALQLAAAATVRTHLRKWLADRRLVRSVQRDARISTDSTLASSFLAQHGCFVNRVDRAQESAFRAMEDHNSRQLPQIWIEDRAVPLLVGQTATWTPGVPIPLFRPVRLLVAASSLTICVLVFVAMLALVQSTVGFTSNQFAASLGIKATGFAVLLLTAAWIRWVMSPSGRLEFSDRYGVVKRPLRSPVTIDPEACRVVITAVLLPGLSKRSLAPVWWIFPREGGCVIVRCARPDQTPWGPAIGRFFSNLQTIGH